METGKVDKKIKKGSTEYKKYIQDQREKLSIQRFKGLGEMNPDELWETTLNPENNLLLKVNYSELNGASSSPTDSDNEIFFTLMAVSYTHLTLPTILRV